MDDSREDSEFDVAEPTVPVDEPVSEAEPEPPATHTPRAVRPPGYVRAAFRLRKPLYAAVAVLVATQVYSSIGAGLARKWTDSQERSRWSRVLKGAEERTLGPPEANTAVLFVHGFVGAGQNFWDVPDRLAAKGYRVRVMRLPGHGSSPIRLRDTEWSEPLNAVFHEFHELKSTHENVVLVGHSMGGALSTIVASTAGADGLVLAAPYFGVTHKWFYGLSVETWSAFSAPLVRWIYKGDAFLRVKRPEAKSQILSYRWFHSDSVRMLHRYGEIARDPELLHDIAGPVLFIHARDDFAASPKRALEAYENTGSSDKEFVWLENSDHHIFWDYDREEVWSAIEDFMDANFAN